MEYEKALSVTETSIPGLLILDLPVHGDARGWFKENWQREKMLSLGLPDFAPVQNNMSFNATTGTTRGIHAEPWDKFISVATGRVFGAWVDLREGSTFGAVFTAVIDPTKAIFVPRGVANSFQTLDDDTAYSYLVNDHWSADSQELYTFVNLADPTLNIAWPIPLSNAVISDKDLQHPLLADVAPMPPKKTLIIGANGQLGRALQHVAKQRGRAHWEFADRSVIDLFDRETLGEISWNTYDTVINAAAYTRVDDAETIEGRKDAWAVNASGTAALATHCERHRITLVHISTDYVFDGSVSVHREDETLSPLGVYGQSKAAGETSVLGCSRHYVVRTSWVIGDGANFIKTMSSLAQRGVSPTVVNDQVGRLTFAADLAEAIDELLSIRPDFGIYNISNSGEPASWCDIATKVFTANGRSPHDVTGVSTEEYFSGASDRVVAPRPRSSVFDLTKITTAGVALRDQWQALDEYLAAQT